MVSFSRCLASWHYRVSSEHLEAAVETLYSCCPVVSGGSFGEDLFVDDGRFHLAARVPAPVVVPVDEPGDLAMGLGFGHEPPTRQQLPLESRVETFGNAVDGSIHELPSPGKHLICKTHHRSLFNAAEINPYPCTIVHCDKPAIANSNFDD